MTKKMNIAEDNVLVLKLGSEPVLNIKRLMADCTTTLDIALPKK